MKCTSLKNLCLFPPLHVRRAALAQALVDSVDILSMNYCFDQFAHLGRLFPGKAVQSTESQAFFAYDGWKAVERNPHALGELDVSGFLSLFQKHRWGFP